jgi:methylamine utilization protein MauE
MRRNYLASRIAWYLSSRAARTVDLALALLLLAAAALKFRELASPAPIIPGLIHQRYWLAALVQIELLQALWFLVGGFLRLRFICATFCFSLFAFAAGYEAFHAMPSCGCFGNVKIPPALTALFDLGAVVALVVTRPRVAIWKPDRPGRSLLAIAGTLTLALSATIWIVFFRNAPTAVADYGNLVVLDPATWIGKPFPLLEDIDNASPLRSGRWIVLLYHYDCDDCLRAIPQYQALARSNSRLHIAFAAIPPAAPAGRDPVADSADYLHLTLRADHDWFATTPIVAAIQNGQVLAAASGENAMQPPDVPQWRIAHPISDSDRQVAN